MDTIPGADILGFGFDILKPYDKSSTTSRIFNDGEADKSQTTIGGVTYGVPENISVVLQREKKGDSQVFSTRQKVQEHFALKAGITGSGFGFKGHFDMSYSKTTNSDKSYYYALVEASDRSYTLKLGKQGNAWLDSDFKEELNALPKAFSTESRDAFFSFFMKYGTHIVSQVELGGHLYYYVAVEKSFSSDETKVKANMEAEYKGMFAKVKAEAESTWNTLDKNWSSSRIVSLHAQGGDTSIFDSLEPGFREWKGESYSKWIASLASQPGVSGFSLTPITKLFAADRLKDASKALSEYLKGGMIVSADRVLSTAPGQEFIAYPTIIGPHGDVEHTQPPVGTEVGGVQIVLFEPDTFKVLLNRTFYGTQGVGATVPKMYEDIKAEIKNIRATDYYCAVSVFGLLSLWYPPPEIVSWLNGCGAQLSAWKNYIGKTASGAGIVCYTFGGRKGSRVGATEDFRIDMTHRVNQLNSTSMYFLYGEGLRAKAEG